MCTEPLIVTGLPIPFPPFLNFKAAIPSACRDLILSRSFWAMYESNSNTMLKDAWQIKVVAENEDYATMVREMYITSL